MMREPGEQTSPAGATPEVPLSIRLKQETLPEHRRLEERLGLPRERFDRSELVHLLGRFYGYYVPCEAQLDTSPAELRQLLLPRRKTPLLARDLERLGHSRSAIDSLPRCEVPPTNSEAETLGRWYVLEGSTLGGQLLNRWLAGLPGLEAGSLFFASYGPQVGPMWRAYCQRLDQHPAAERNQIVASARQTFLTLGDWLCECQ